MKVEKKQTNSNDAHFASGQSVRSLTNEKGTVPGQQIGLYSKGNYREVRQVVQILNPDVDSMESRG